jgi:PD-(D/E)XK endonuclease
MNPNLIGNIAEAAIVFRALRAGVEVLRPQAEHVRYDLAFDISGRFYRVQCKTARLKDGAVAIRTRTCRRTADGYERGRYTADEVDLIAGYCPGNDTSWLVPISKLEGVSQFHIRIDPARNGQRAAINFAADYEFAGAVAQLEERRYGIPKVTGSSPVSSTPFQEVGAEPFGTHTGRFLQRAAAGESFLVTRRGRPMARVLPPAALLRP